MKQQGSKTNKEINILLTGSSSGIGYNASLKLLKYGYSLILPCRDKNSADRTIENLKKDIGGADKIKSNLICPIMDLSDLESINQYDKFIKSNQCA